MSDRAKILKVTAIIASFSAILCLVLMIIFSAKESFAIYPYLCWLIGFVSCIRLWKMYVDAKKA
jgi:undecaprenyl pyrophosphate phosphatase UppP